MTYTKIEQNYLAKLKSSILITLCFCLVNLFLIPSIAFPGSLTITRSGSSYNSISQGKTSFDEYQYDTDNGGVRIGNGSHSAKLTYEILLPFYSHDANHQISSITVTVEGKCNYSPKIIIGGYEHDLSNLDGVKTLPTYYHASARNLLTSTYDSFASELKIEFEVGSLLAYLDLKEIKIIYEYSGVPIDTLKRFQEAYSAYRTFKEYKDVIDNSWLPNAENMTDIIKDSCQKAIAFAQNISNISGTLFEALDAWNDSLDSFIDFFNGVEEVMDKFRFHMHYDVGNWCSFQDISTDMTDTYISLKDYADDLFRLGFDGNILDDLIGLNHLIDIAHSKVGSTQIDLNSAKAGFWDIYKNHPDDGAETAEAYFLSLAVMFTIPENYSTIPDLTAPECEPNYCGGLLNQLTHIQSETTTYTITASSGTNGSIDPEGDVYVEQGGSKTFNATPDFGWEVYQWEKEGVPVQTGGNIYTVSNVQENTTILVTFNVVQQSTPAIQLSGDNLAFGNVTVGQTSQRTLTIHNNGNSDLTVSGISYPTGFSGNWSGTISAGGSHNVIVTFAPTAATSYGGTVTVNSNKMSGVNTISCSGAGTPTPTQSVTILSDDFEAYTLYDWPAENWVADANARSDPSKNRIELDPSGGQNQVLRLYGVENGSYWAALTYYPVEYPTEFTVYCRVFNGAENIFVSGHMNRATIDMRHGTDWHNYARGLIRFGDGTISGSGTELGTYQTERWYDVRIHYKRNGPDLTVSYWLDGVFLKTVSVEIPDPLAEDSLDHVELSSQAGSSWFDDLRIVEGRGDADYCPIPTGQPIWDYASAVHPIKQSNPANCKPFAVGDLSTGNLNLQVGLPVFSSGVDVYLALGFSDALFLIDGSNMLYSASDLTALPKWKANVSVAIDESLYGDIPTSSLPAGTYNLYTLVVPAGETDFSHFYLWSTSFTISTGINDGLVAYYPFNGNANDESGNGNNGTVYGASLTEDRFGNVSSAYLFDGVNDFVDIGNLRNLVQEEQGSFSIWINVNAFPPYPSVNGNFIFEGDLDTQDRFYLAVSDNTNAGISFGYMNVGICIPYTSVQAHVWYHIVGTWENGQVSIYLNGSLVDSKSGVIVMDFANDNFGLGKAYNTNNRHYDGRIDDFRIYDHALDAAEIMTLYNQ